MGFSLKTVLLRLVQGFIIGAGGIALAWLLSVLI